VLRLSSQTRDTLVGFSTLLGNQLPGPLPELAFFLDRTVFRDPLEQMRAAWTAAPSEELGTTLAEVEAFFASPAHTGRTVIVVSHVEDGQMALRYDADSPRLRIADVEAAAMRHGVLLVLVGCQTAGAAVGVGFSQTIRTEKVEAFLRELPRAPTIRQLFGAMAGIGSLVVDAPGFTSKVTAVVGDPDTGGKLAEVVLSSAYWDIVPASPPPSASSWSWFEDNTAPPGFVDPDAWLRPFRLMLPSLTAVAWLVELGAGRASRKRWFLERRERLRWLVRLVRVHAVARVILWLGLVGSVPLGLWLDFDHFVYLSVPAAIGFAGLANWAIESLKEWAARTWLR
jgi:hypothetical protein